MQPVFEPAEIRLLRIGWLLWHNQIRESDALLAELLPKQLSHNAEKVIAVIEPLVKQKVEPLTNEWQSAQRARVHHPAKLNARLHNFAHFSGGVPGCDERTRDRARRCPGHILPVEAGVLKSL